MYFFKLSNTVWIRTLEVFLFCLSPTSGYVKHCLRIISLKSREPALTPSPALLLVVGHRENPPRPWDALSHPFPGVLGCLRTLLHSCQQLLIGFEVCFCYQWSCIHHVNSIYLSCCHTHLDLNKYLVNEEMSERARERPSWVHQES